MTRKKSRPQHREDVSPKSANEGGFYKMFWNSMEGDEGNDASAPSPDNLPQNSPTVIVINDSDDENPYTIDDSSGDITVIPPPIKQEVSEVQTSAGKSVLNQSAGNRLEKTIEDGVQATLQPTSLVLCPKESCDVSINSPHPVADQTEPENVVRSPDRANFPSESFPVPQDQSIVFQDDLDIDRTVHTVEFSPLHCGETTTSEPQVPENGDQCRDLEVSQLCSISSADQPIGHPTDIDCSTPLESGPVESENRCQVEDISGKSKVKDNTNLPPAMPETTGQALELLKSLLGEGDPSTSTPFNNESDMDISIDHDEPCSNSSIINPLQIKKEIAESHSLSSNVPHGASDSSDQHATCYPTQDESSGLVELSVATPFELPVDVEPTVTQVEPVLNNKCKSPLTDDFPTFGHILPFKIKIEHSCIKPSLDLLKNELFTLYNNCHVKIAFERKTDSEVAEKSTDSLKNDEMETNILDGTAPCRVMMERLPTPLVIKGHASLGSKAFQTWKSSSIRVRNEEKFRHLGVWRRGRTRLWRECQLAGMDKASYDEQVKYIMKHIISESSSSEDDSSDDELYNQLFEPAGLVTSSADESEFSEVHSEIPSSPAASETLQSTDSTTAEVSGLTKAKSLLPTSKVKGFKSVKHQSRSKDIVPITSNNDLSSCRDEYVVERSTVHDDLHSEGQKTAPLKITIRKTSVNKSEDEREKSVESEVENNFTVPLKPSNKKFKRTFVTKRTYRKPEEYNSPGTDSLNDNEPQKKRRVQSLPHYIDDNNEDEESLLGRRSHEVENFNLLEKWDIPFEEPTLFRSPRVASRLAQLKNKEAFSKKVRQQPVHQKPAPSKEVKDVVEMLCSKTVEAMLCPDIISKAIPATKSIATVETENMVPKPQNAPLEVEIPSEAGQVLPQHVPETDDVPAEICDKDTSETQSITNDETSSTIDTSEFGDSPKKVVAKKRKKPRLSNYRKRKGRAKPSLKSIENSSADEKIDNTEEVSTKVPPLQSTQVPVVSEGPGQSPLESEDDAVQLKETVAGSETVDSLNKDNEERGSPLVTIPELDIGKSDNVCTGQNSRAKLPIPPSSNTDVPTTRVTRSKRPIINIDPEVLENVSTRKVNRKSSDRTSTSLDKSDVDKPANQPIKKKKGKASLPQEVPLKETKDSNELNTQVHEISEGPGEVMELEAPLMKPSSANASNDDTSVVKELENAGSREETRVDLNNIIPDSPMSPNPDAEEIEPVQPRMTRSKKRMMREGSGYVAVKKSENSSEDNSTAVDSVAKVYVGTEELVKDSSKEVIETTGKSQLAPLDGDTCESGSSIKPVMASTDVLKHSTSSILESETSPAVTIETPVIQEKESLDLTDRLVVQLEPDQTTNTSSVQVDDPSQAIPPKTSDSIVSLIQPSKQLGEHPTETSTSLLPAEEITTKPQETLVTNEVSPKKTAGNTEEITAKPQETLVTNEVSPKKTAGNTEEITAKPQETLVTNEVSPKKTAGNTEEIIAKPQETLVTNEVSPKKTAGNTEEITAKPQETLVTNEVSPKKTAGNTEEIIAKPQETLVTNEVSPKKTAGNTVSLDVTDGSSVPADPNTSRERKAVLETLNSILKISTQNKKIAESLNSGGNSDAFNDKEPVIELGNASDDELDSGDATGDLVVDEDRDFSDDDDNSAELATRIDQIVKDQIKGDIEPASGAETRAEKSKELSSKRRDSIDERTGLPTVLIQKLRDPRIRSKLLSHLEDNDETASIETVPPLTQSVSSTQADSTRAPISEKPIAVKRDPRTRRTVADDCRIVETPSKEHGLAAATTGVSIDRTNVGGVPNTTSAPGIGRGGATVPSNLRDSANFTAAGLRSNLNPAAQRGASNPGAVLRGPVASTPPLGGGLCPAVRGALPAPNLTPRAPLLPTPAALLSTVAALRNSSPANSPPVNPRTNPTPTNEFAEQNEVDDDEEESLKRRPKKQKKELDTELMYKSPLEDLQSEARPTYGRNPPRRNARNERQSYPRSDRGRNNSSEVRPSRWDARNNDRRPERDNPRFSEPKHPPNNQDQWGEPQNNERLNAIQSDPHMWKQRNWYPEYNTNYNTPQPNENMVKQGPRLSYMETHLLNLSLLPKTTNLNSPPFTKIYTYFNHGNPQILGIAPPTYDPNEKASTITMMDPMGQEMIDIVQLPRPTSGLTSGYFNDLPDEFSLEDLVTHPYLALSDMMDEEVEIENHGTNIFNDSDEEQRIIRGNVASRRHVNDPRNRPSVLLDKTDNVENEGLKAITTGDPLENILHCLPALKEQYSFKKNTVNLEDDDSSDKPIAPPPPTWSTDMDLRQKEKHPNKIAEPNESVRKNWRNPSPPKRKKKSKPHSPKRRNSRSKSPPHRKMRRRLRSKSPSRRPSKSPPWRRSKSRSPFSKGSSRLTRSRSNSPIYQGGRSTSRSRGTSQSRGHSRSNSMERPGHGRKFKRSRSRSPAYRKGSSSISPSRKRHTRR